MVIDTKSFIEKASKVHNNKYDYSESVYTKSNKKLTIICPIHGKFEQIANVHLDGKDCKKCGYQKVIKKLKQPEKGKSLFDEYPDICKYWSEKNELGPNYYKSNSHSKVKWKCSNCLDCYTTSIARRIIAKYGLCKICNRKQINISKTTAKSGKSIFDIYPELSNSWSNKNTINPESVKPHSRKELWWKCIKCHTEWQVAVYNRTRNKTGCPKCNNSRGEISVENFLTKNNIKYQRQYRIKECRGRRNPLAFDFAIWIDNKLALIEYNGEQHYSLRKSGHYSSSKKLEETQRRDKIKVDFCSQQNIPLLVIPYTEYSKIDNHLKSFIKEL